MADDTPISVRIPNDLKKQIATYAETNRLYRSGNPNLSGALILLAREFFAGNVPQSNTLSISDNVAQSNNSNIEDLISSAIAPLIERIEALEANQVVTADAVESAQKPLMPIDEEESVSSSESEALPIIKAIEALPTVAITKKATKPKSTSKTILTRPEALEIAKKFGFNRTGQNLYDWAKSALNAKSDDTKQSAREKLADFGLAPSKSDDGGTAWVEL